MPDTRMMTLRVWPAGATGFHWELARYDQYCNVRSEHRSIEPLLTADVATGAARCFAVDHGIEVADG